MATDLRSYYTPYLESLAPPWRDHLARRLSNPFDERRHGDLRAWKTAIAQLPDIDPADIDLAADTVRIGRSDDVQKAQRILLKAILEKFIPWRKGPFELFGIPIDTEWRSDWKWRRLAEHIQPLAGRNVIDVGCGSGYHCWRMRAAGAEQVTGIDPYLPYVMQFIICQHYIRDAGVAVLPLGIDDLPPDAPPFDTVFSMGVLYHRRSPLDHLQELRALLRPGGELVLETLIIEGAAGMTLVPAERYARMRNVWFIPSGATLESWLRRMGFIDIRCVDVTATTVAEQRQTRWMPFESLEQALDPGDPNKTVEGHPAPLRAIFLAERPR